MKPAPPEGIPASRQRLGIGGVLVSALLASTALAGDAPYTRKSFGGWVDADRDCQDTRAEVLVSRSLVPVTFTGPESCRVADGLWLDVYNLSLVRDASRLDIDHVVPLAEAWRSGADEWSAEQRKSFANDPQNLAVTSLSTNRGKGDKTPEQWVPSSEVAHCMYLARYEAIKNSYALKSSPKEKIALHACRLAVPL